MDDVYGPRSGGAIIFVDAENARKGVAKTSAACAWARLFARGFGYDLKKDDLTLSAGEYLQRYRDHPGHDQPSVLVLDEFVGAGAGDARRAMSTQNVDFGKAWQMLRTKRVVTLATLPDWGEADKRLRKYADYRIWCREKPIGHCHPYKITTGFADESGGLMTAGLNYHGDGARRIKFPNMDSNGDAFYRHLCKKKDNLIHSGTWDADELGDDGEAEQPADPDEIRRRVKTEVAIRLYEPWDDDNSHNYREVGRAVEKSDSWAGNRIREWRDGEHRDLVEDPTES